MRCLHSRLAAQLLLSAVVLWLGACANPVQRSLLEARLRVPKMDAKALRITSVEVVDMRPESELKEMQPETHVLVPLIPLWWQEHARGPLRPNARYYSPNTAAELQSLVQDTLARSGLAAAASDARLPGMTLRVELRHLYATTYADQQTMLGLGGAYTKTQIFAPYGFASAEVSLVASSQAGGSRHRLGPYVISAHTAPTATSLGLTDAQVPASVMDALTLAAVDAAGALAVQCVHAVEALLHQHPLLNRIDPKTSTLFFLRRATDDGQFAEVAGVTVASGEIASVAIVPQLGEQIAAYREWVVDPYHGGTVRLPWQDYQALIARLSANYDVRFTHNLRAAHFFGKRAQPLTNEEDSATPESPSLPTQGVKDDDSAAFQAIPSPEGRSTPTTSDGSDVKVKPSDP